jgi:hypothetical protein
MIANIFLFNHKIELIEQRLRRNWYLFDKLTIIQGNRTFKGKERYYI